MTTFFGRWTLSSIPCPSEQNIINKSWKVIYVFSGINESQWLLFSSIRAKCDLKFNYEPSSHAHRTRITDFQLLCKSGLSVLILTVKYKHRRKLLGFAGAERRVREKKIAANPGRTSSLGGSPLIPEIGFVALIRLKGQSVVLGRCDRTGGCCINPIETHRGHELRTD